MVHHIMQAAVLASFAGSWNFHFFIPLLPTLVEVTAEDDGNVSLPTVKRKLDIKNRRRGHWLLRHSRTVFSIYKVVFWFVLL
jgi:hypothetical protein